MHALTACRLANTCRVEPSGFDENVFRLFRDHGVKAAHDSRQGHRLFGVSDDQVFRMQLALDAVECLEHFSGTSAAHDDSSTFEQIEIEGVGGMPYLVQGVVAGVNGVADAARAQQLQPFLNFLRRRGDLYPADDACRVAGASRLIFDLDLEIGFALRRRQLRLDRLQLKVVDGRALTGHAVVVHGVHAVGGKVHFKDSVRAFAVERFHGNSGVRQFVSQSAVVGLDLHKFAQPRGRDSHANCSRKRTSPW